jgi:hypothetical protein
VHCIFARGVGGKWVRCPTSVFLIRDAAVPVQPKCKALILLQLYHVPSSDHISILLFLLILARKGRTCMSELKEIVRTKLQALLDCVFRLLKARYVWSMPLPGSGSPHQRRQEDCKPGQISLAQVFGWERLRWAGSVLQRVCQIYFSYAPYPLELCFLHLNLRCPMFSWCKVFPRYRTMTNFARHILLSCMHDNACICVHTIYTSIAGKFLALTRW